MTTVYFSAEDWKNGTLDAETEQKILVMVDIARIVRIIGEVVELARHKEPENIAA